MKQRTKHLDVIHHGMVLLSDGKGNGRPARMELTKDTLTIQVSTVSSDEEMQPETSVDNDAAIRSVKLRKQKEGGLGISIKGGSDGTQSIPIIISKIFPNTPAEQSGLLYVGDSIVEVNEQSVEGKTHDEVVQLLRDAGDEVTLSVRRQTQIAPFMKPTTALRMRSRSAFDKLSETSTWKSSLRAHSENEVVKHSESRQSLGGHGKSSDEQSGDWKTLIKIPLPMAFLTRYLWGTDKIRNNAFEVRAVDGTSSGIVHCDDKKALEQWIKHIQNHIASLNYKIMKMSNKYSHKSEEISYIGWLSERLPEDHFEDPKQRWEPRFIILKGGQLCIFESPPLNSEDLNSCISLYKIYDTAFRTLEKGKAEVDKRTHCFWIETCIQGAKHYFNTETQQQYIQFEHAYNRCLHSTITNLQTRTFACSYEGRPCGLVVDIKHGISLYDIPTKRYTWQYRFLDLYCSSDDGKIRLQLIFRDKRSSSQNGLEIKNIDCDEVLTIVFTLHAFYVTKIIATDPDFLKTIPLC